MDSGIWSHRNSPWRSFATVMWKQKKWFFKPRCRLRFFFPRNDRTLRLLSRMTTIDLFAILLMNSFRKPWPFGVNEVFGQTTSRVSRWCSILPVHRLVIVSWPRRSNRVVVNWSWNPLIWVEHLNDRNWPINIFFFLFPMDLHPFESVVVLFSSFLSDLFRRLNVRPRTNRSIRLRTTLLVENRSKPKRMTEWRTKSPRNKTKKNIFR